MRIKTDSLFVDFLRLGIQTNPGNVSKQSLWLAKQWAPKKCKSFTIKSLSHTDYYGNSMPEETGYATMDVEYFTTVKEGEIKC